MNVINISVLLPTRGRKEPLLKCLDSLLENAKDNTNIEVLLGVDTDDTEVIEYVETVIIPKYYQVTMYLFKQLGYEKLNMYYNTLANLAYGKWLFVFNDDVILETQDWDNVIYKYESHPMPLLRVNVRNMDHPFALFPIIKKEMIEVMGQLSPYSHIDRFLYNCATNICNGIVIDIPVDVIHDRFDITGANNDETFKNSISTYAKTEGNPLDPANDDYPTQHQYMLMLVNRLRQHINNKYNYAIPLIDLSKPVQVIKKTTASHGCAK